jgi:hypothetical protein
LFALEDLVPTIILCNNKIQMLVQSHQIVVVAIVSSCCRSNRRRKKQMHGVEEIRKFEDEKIEKFVDRRIFLKKSSWSLTKEI